MLLKDKTILVTGASSGLGYEMAYQLATKHEADVIIVARREGNLLELKAKIEKVSDRKVHVVAADLSKEADLDKVSAYCLAEPSFMGAILNAGITHFGAHEELEWSYFERMVSVNIMGVVRLTNTFVKHFEASNTASRLMIVSSMASLYPVPYQTAYSGTKGFLTNFANALSQEINNKQFKVSAFCPGGIKTEMTGGDDFSSLSNFLEPVEKVAASGINGFLKGKVTFVPGLLNNLSTTFLKLLPRDFILKQTGKIYRKALKK